MDGLWRLFSECPREEIGDLERGGGAPGLVGVLLGGSRGIRSGSSGGCGGGGLLLLLEDHDKARAGGEELLDPAADDLERELAHADDAVRAAKLRRLPRRGRVVAALKERAVADGHAHAPLDRELARNHAAQLLARHRVVDRRRLVQPVADEHPDDRSVHSFVLLFVSFPSFRFVVFFFSRCSRSCFAFSCCRKNEGLGESDDHGWERGGAHVGVHGGSGAAVRGAGVLHTGPSGAQEGAQRHGPRAACRAVCCRKVCC